MKAILKKPGEAPEIISVDNELKALQKVIGGWLESFTFAADACILCDEEGRLKDLPFNVKLFGNPFFGNILLVGVNDDEFCDFPDPDAWVDYLTELHRIVGKLAKAHRRKADG